MYLLIRYLYAKYGVHPSHLLESLATSVLRMDVHPSHWKNLHQVFIIMIKLTVHPSHRCYLQIMQVFV